MLRRRGIIRLNEDDLIRLLRLPIEFTIESVNASWHTFSIDIMVSGGSLPQVEPGVEPQIIPGKLDRDSSGVLQWRSSEF